MTGIIQTALPTAGATTNVTPNVDNWYRSALNRDAEVGGRDYWNEQIQKTGDAAKVYQDFLAAAKANTEHVKDVDYASANTYTGPMSTNSTTPVDDVARNVLGRDFTPQEMQIWQTRFADASKNGVDGVVGAYNELLKTYAGEVKNNLDWASAMQISAPQNTTSAPSPVTTPQSSTPSAATYNPSTYTADKLGDPTKWNITADQTVEGRILNLLDKNNPLTMQARTGAAQESNARGIINSTMATTAADDAAYRAAIPIATSDAATYAKAAGYNADMPNQFAVRNQDATNTQYQFNSTAINQAGQFNAGQINDMTKAVMADKTQRDLAQLEAETRMNIAKLDSSTRTNLATIEANYKTLMQSNSSASDLYRQVTQNLATISMSKDLDGAAKQTAITNQLELLKAGMGVNGKISNLNLGDLLNFNVTMPTTPAAATTTTTPASIAAGEQYGGGGV